MGDRMTPIPFADLMDWILSEKQRFHKVFGQSRFYRVPQDEELARQQTRHIFSEKIETPFGPAAGPHTQLAQNIISAYLTGSRFFELKTVQILDGEDLPVAKPCILADDEGYNCEWSTELRVADAFAEYVKAWVALKVLAKEFELGDSDGFVFNMSVGYDLKGIQSEKIDTFIENMKEAKDTSVFQEAIQWLREHLDRFTKVQAADLDAISSKIASSVTVSTLHGCPPDEIERIAAYLLKEKKLNTFVKCNPTLLGYEKARKIMDEMGYGYLVFGEFHFQDDLQLEDAIPMLKRLQELSEQEGLSFGVKITNTFPVDVTRNELPSEEMYMSGKALCVLSLSVAQLLSEAFWGRLRISYSGGADYFNIEQIYRLGIWPITIATTLLKPGGYQRGIQLAEILTQAARRTSANQAQPAKIDTAGLKALIEALKEDRHYRKAIKPLAARKMAKKVPLIDCYTAPCSEGCPIHQDIPAYLKKVAAGDYPEALRIILDKNPLPFITGTICNHRCMSKCARNFYEQPIEIRAAKLAAAEGAFDEILKALPEPAFAKQNEKTQTRAAIVGGGPAGIAAAYFLARAGVKAAVFEKSGVLGGLVRQVIPEFRIAKEAIDKDVLLAERMGAELLTNHPIEDLKALREMGFHAIFLAVGASRSRALKIPAEKEINAIRFLKDVKSKAEDMKVGAHVVVVGAGNTAMDAARAAKRIENVQDVTIVYRRTMQYMPADEEELELAIQEGIVFRELLAPIEQRSAQLICRKMKLGEVDASGRQTPVETNETIQIPADTVISALGEQLDTEYYRSLGLEATEKGAYLWNDQTMETSAAGVYLIGDGAKGPDTVVTAIRDASLAVNHLLHLEQREILTIAADIEENTAKKGILAHCTAVEKEEGRCLSCDHICERCVDVCPNRANVVIDTTGLSPAGRTRVPTIIHLDYMCNECGNCKTFCPYDSAPYQEKLTFFLNEADFNDSSNEGFVILKPDPMQVKLRLGERVLEASLSQGASDPGFPEVLKHVIRVFIENYEFYWQVHQSRPE